MELVEIRLLEDYDPYPKGTVQTVDKGRGDNLVEAGIASYNLHQEPHFRTTLENSEEEI